MKSSEQVREKIEFLNSELEIYREKFSEAEDGSNMKRIYFEYCSGLEKRIDELEWVLG